MDFGCGQKPYKQLFHHVDEYIGVDFENPGHSHKDEAIDIFYDGKTIPVADQHFDAIFCTEVFEHIFNLDEIIKELNRVMKVNGKILVTCPFAYCEHEAPNDFARYSSYAMKHIMERNGFRVIEQVKTGNSVEALNQLWLTYLHVHIMHVLNRIPVVRSFFKSIIYTPFNLISIGLGKLLPKGKDLYISNVLFAEKISGPLAD